MCDARRETPATSRLSHTDWRKCKNIVSFHCSADLFITELVKMCFEMANYGFYYLI